MAEILTSFACHYLSSYASRVERNEQLLVVDSYREVALAGGLRGVDQHSIPEAGAEAEREGFARAPQVGTGCGESHVPRQPVVGGR